MKTVLIVMFACVAVALGATLDSLGVVRLARDTSAYGAAARADAGAVGEEAAVMSAVEDAPERTVSGAAASAKHGAVFSSSGIRKVTVRKYD